MHHYKFDLGISRLKSQWKEIFSTRFLREDFFAGATVACIAIPLSLAIGLASDVEPGQALVTAIVAGIVCAFFGGTPLSVSGPAAAMAVIVASNVEKFGMGGLLIIGLLCGVFQLLSGIFGLGRFARFVPIPVISGFTAGIGAIILIGQLPRVLGLAPPDQAHVFYVISHIATYLHETQWAAVLIAGLTLTINMGLPKIFPKLPAPLCAVGISTLVTHLFSFQIGLIGTIPRSLPVPKFPALPTEGWGALVASAFIVFLIASLETLLSCSAIDKLRGGEKHDPDQELVGQGLGNLASSLFGGIPVTAVIARSALNLRSGARTRRSSLIHSIFLILSVLIFAPALQMIPVAALAGVLISIALVMLHPGELRQLWKASRSESMIYLVTFFTIVFVDLLAGVQAGVVAMLGLILYTQKPDLLNYI
jgi:carbonic anhydrase